MFEQHIMLNCAINQSTSNSTGRRNEPTATTTTSSTIKELHIAPMLHVSTVEFHALMRILTKRCILWTEMIVDETIYFQRQRQQQPQQQRQLQRKQKMLNSTSNSNNIQNSGNHTDDDKDDNNTIRNSCVDDNDNNNDKEDIPMHILYPVQNENHPIICQIGTIQVEWTKIATQYIINANYNVKEMNINLDCPSSKVQGKEFGAVLMKDTTKVIAFVQTIQQQLPSNMCVSIKCRIGIITIDSNHSNDIIDDNDNRSSNTIKTNYGWIVQFIKELSSVCQRFILHARPVILNDGGIHSNNNSNNNPVSTGKAIISPKQNRCIPPLNYVWVYRLCYEFPSCDFIINGGITDLEMAKQICYGIADSDNNTNNNDKTLSYVENNDDIDTYYYDHGGYHQNDIIPCSKCQQPYGSCIVPPLYPAPTNLRGCMIGRAAIDHPIQFAKADHFWYNDTNTDDTNNCDENDDDCTAKSANRSSNTNKATTRRQVLQQYCQFLDTLYPRRCCDNDDTIITNEIPSPTIDFLYPFCSICKEFRQSSFVSSCSSSTGTTSTTGSVVVSPSNETPKKKPVVKIATKIIDRSLKPILNTFHGCYGSKVFKYNCEELRRNPTIRNCGPAYIIYHAITTMYQQQHQQQQSNILDTVLDECIV